jgi:hypothetical protein
MEYIQKQIFNLTVNVDSISSCNYGNATFAFDSIFISDIPYLIKKNFCVGIDTKLYKKVDGKSYKRLLTFNDLYVLPNENAELFVLIGPPGKPALKKSGKKCKNFTNNK